jgi:hypothetical protein
MQSKRLPEPLHDLLCGQSDLSQMCAPRPLDWSEYAHMNEFHGNAGILKSYAELPLDQPLPVAVEHAIPYDLSEPYQYDLHSGLPAFWAVHEKSAQVYRAAGMQEVHPIGFSYLYAMDVFHRLYPREGERQRMGTIVFPDKSTLLMDTDFDRAAFARQLARLPEEFQPVVVSIYWKDFIRGNHKVYTEAGLPVVSAGHVRDASFPLRLYDLCRRFKYACANDISSSFTLSILSGCHFFHLDTGPLTQKKYGKTNEYAHDPTLDKPAKRECLAAAPYPPQDSTAQRELAQRHAGARFKQSAETLRQLYAQAQEMLRARVKTTTITFGEGIERPVFYGLLPSGIDWDGWCAKLATFRVPRASGAKAIRLQLFLGIGLDAHVRTLRVYRNKKLYQTIRPLPIEQTVEWKCRFSKGVSHFELYAQEDHPLPGEERRRAFRIQAMELLAKPTPKPRASVAVTSVQDQEMRPNAI